MLIAVKTATRMPNASGGTRSPQMFPGSFAMIIRSRKVKNKREWKSHANYVDGDILAIDRAYIDYLKIEELAQRGVTYVTKMKKTLFTKPFPTRYT